MYQENRVFANSLLMEWQHAYPNISDVTSYFELIIPFAMKLVTIPTRTRKMSHDPFFVQEVDVNGAYNEELHIISHIPAYCMTLEIKNHKVLAKLFCKIEEVCVLAISCYVLK